MPRKQEIEQDIARVVHETSATLYYPGGSGGGGGKRGRGGASAVVLPHARTSSGCKLCTKYHTTAEHRRHAKNSQALNKPAKAKAKAKPKAAKAGKPAAKSKSKTTAKATSPRVRAAAPAKTPIGPHQDRQWRQLMVLDAVRSIPESGRFGPDKVFISEIWDRVSDQLGMSFEQFKRWLIELNRDGVLTLARADLIGAMNREKVQRSEIQDRGATYHFVIDPAAPLW